MGLAKYQNLPDIDLESPETYENEVPVTHNDCLSSHETVHETCLEQVQTQSLSLETSKEKFKNSNAPCFYTHQETKAQKLSRLIAEWEDLRLEFEKDSSLDDTLKRQKLIFEDQFNKIHAQKSAAQRPDRNALLEKLNQFQAAFISQESFHLLAASVNDSKSKTPILSQIKTLPELESRVAQLEQVLGISVSSLDSEPIQTNLLGKLQDMDNHLKALNDETFLNQWIPRLQEFNKLLENHSQDEEIHQLYRLLSLEIIDMVPGIIERLVSLKDVQDYATDVVGTVKNMQQQLNQQQQIAIDLVKSMDQMKKTMQENNEKLDQNLERLFKRIDALQ